MFLLLFLGILSTVSVQAAQEGDYPVQHGLTRAQFLYLQAQDLEPPVLRRQSRWNAYDEIAREKRQESKRLLKKSKRKSSK